MVNRRDWQSEYKCALATFYTLYASSACNLYIGSPSSGAEVRDIVLPTSQLGNGSAHCLLSGPAPGDTLESHRDCALHSALTAAAPSPGGGRNLLLGDSSTCRSLRFLTSRHLRRPSAPGGLHRKDRADPLEEAGEGIQPLTPGQRQSFLTSWKGFSVQH